MFDQNFKLHILNVIIISSMLTAMDETGIPPEGAASDHAARSLTFPPPTDDNFAKLMHTLKTINVGCRKIQPWENAISEYQNSFSDPALAPSLESIKDRVLSEKMDGKRRSRLGTVFNKLLEPALPPAPASSPVLPSTLPPSASPDLGMMPYTIFFHMPTKQMPNLSSRLLPRKRPSAELTETSCDEGLEAVSAPVEKTILPIAKYAIPSGVISARIGKFIAGQEDAIGSLSLLAHRFLCNKTLIDRGMDPVSKPAHCILTGPTGCGKSESLKQLGESLGVPILHINARGLTDEGFKGQNFSEYVSSFCEEHNNPLSAIVAIDEIDKLGNKGGDDTKNFGRAVQRLLLSPLDGSPLSLKGRRFLLTNWWFVGTGAFSSLKGIHDASTDRTTTARTHADIIGAGFEPEFVGRFSSIIPFKGHTVETMMDVISRDGSPLQQIKNEFKSFYGVELVIEDAALSRLSAASIELNLGVRSLNTILGRALRPLYDEAARMMDLEGDGKTITVGLRDIKPALDQFIRDNKEVQKELPDHVRHLYT